MQAIQFKGCLDFFNDRIVLNKIIEYTANEDSLEILIYRVGFKVPANFNFTYKKDFLNAVETLDSYFEVNSKYVSGN